MTTWRTLRAIAERECQPLATLLDRMGGPQIQERATVGGNIMTASSIGDLLPLLYAMDATAEMAHRDGVRQCRLRELIVGPRTVALREGELLTKVRLPLPRTHDRLVLEKSRVVATWTSRPSRLPCTGATTPRVVCRTRPLPPVVWRQPYCASPPRKPDWLEVPGVGATGTTRRRW